MRRAELGVDLGGIWKRTRGVLTFQMGAPEMQELDVGGPLLFAGILGLSHLLVRTPRAWRAVQCPAEQASASISCNLMWVALLSNLVST